MSSIFIETINQTIDTTSADELDVAMHEIAERLADWHSDYTNSVLLLGAGKRLDRIESELFALVDAWNQLGFTAPRDPFYIALAAVEENNAE